MNIKNFIAIFTMITLVIALTGCKDDQMIYGPVQGPVFTYAHDLYYVGSYVDMPLPLIVATSMEVLTDGRIRRLCVILPDNGTYELKLWDLSDTSEIAIANVTATVTDTSCVAISEVRVEAGQVIGLTLYTFDWFYWKDEFDGDIFPKTQGDVRILNYSARGDSPEHIFPPNPVLTALRGIADIEFESELE